MKIRKPKGLTYKWEINEHVLRCGIEAVYQRSSELLQCVTMRAAIVEGLSIIAEMPMKETQGIAEININDDWWKGKYTIYVALDPDEVDLVTAVRKNMTALSDRRVTVGETFATAVCEIAGGRRRKHRVGGRRRSIG